MPSNEIEAMLRACAPLEHFIKCYDEKPMSGSDDEFYAIHTGTEWEASLRRVEFRELVDAAAAVRASLAREPDRVPMLDRGALASRIFLATLVPRAFLSDEQLAKIAVERADALIAELAATTAARAARGESK